MSSLQATAPTIHGGPAGVRRSAGARVLVWLTLIVTTIISLFPFYWLLMTAFTPTESSIKIPPDILPIHASLANFERLFRQAPSVWRWMLNSLVIAGSVTLFHIFFDTLSGYAFAKKSGRGAGAWLSGPGSNLVPSRALPP